MIALHRQLCDTQTISPWTQSPSQLLDACKRVEQGGILLFKTTTVTSWQRIQKENQLQKTIYTNIEFGRFGVYSQPWRAGPLLPSAFDARCRGGEMKHSCSLADLKVITYIIQTLAVGIQALCSPRETVFIHSSTEASGLLRYYGARCCVNSWFKIPRHRPFHVKACDLTETCVLALLQG